MKKDETHFSPHRIEEAARTADAISRARATGSTAGQAALDQARDRLDAGVAGKLVL